MSIKNPLPGHQYGRSEPGYWYPRPDPPARGRSPQRRRRLLGWLCVLLVIAVAVDWSVVRHRQLDAQALRAGSAPWSLSPTAPQLTAPPLTSPSPAVSATTAAPVPTGYAGAQAGDRPAGASGAVTVDGLVVQAGSWVTMNLDGGQKSVCVTASIANRNSAETAYGLMDWSLQSPTGDVHGPVPIMYDIGTQPNQPVALTYGQLIAGGSTSGRVCFADQGPAGTYVVAFRPEVPAAGRGIWLVRL